MHECWRWCFVHNCECPWQEFEDEMSVAEDVEPKGKPWVPRVITGGKGPAEPSSENWLGKLEAGTTFVTRNNKKTVDFELYYVMFATPEVYLLKWQLPDGKMWDRHVNPEEFCRVYREHEVLGYQKQDLEEAIKPKEVTDGNSDRTD